jgi:penicillin-binding protein 1A
MFGIRSDIAGKTGTTQNNTDGWFILMHPSLVAGSWIGFNDPRVKIRSDYWGQGSHNALYVVGDFFRQASNNGAIARAVFPKRPADTFFGQIVDDVEEWLQKKHFLKVPDEVKNILPAPQQPSAEKPLDQEANPINIDKIINEVNDTSTFIQDGIKQIQQKLDDSPAATDRRENNQ